MKKKWDYAIGLGKYKLGITFPKQFKHKNEEIAKIYVALLRSRYKLYDKKGKLTPFKVQITTPKSLLILIPINP